MPYDPNEVMGLTALSPTVAAYKQFMERQNNVGDSNIVPFLVSRGEPQLAGLIAKKLRVENAAKSQQQLAQQPPASPPTVADQYDMAAQQQAMMAPGLPGMPNPVMDRANFAGGGIVAFQGGGFGDYVPPPTAEDILNLEKEAARGNTRAAQTLKYLREQFTTAPTLKKMATGTTSLAGKGVRGLLRGAPYLGAVAGAADIFQSDPEYIQRTSRFGNLLGIDPESKLKTGIATFTSTLESALPTSFFYKTPAERAKEEYAKASQPGIESLLSNDEKAMVAKLQAVKKQYGPNSPEVAELEDRIRAIRGVATTGSSATDAAAELDRYLGLGSIAPGPNRRPQAAPSAAKAQAPATTPAAPEPDALAKLREEVEKLKPEEVKKTTVVSKALDDEEAFIKARKEEAGVSRKQASTEFLINLGASLLANRSPHFTVALGEALKESYGTMSQNLRELKKDADALKIQELKVQAAREQLQRDQDSEAQKTYNDQFRAYQNAVVQFEERRAILADNLSEREFRREQDALNRASAERVEASRQDPLQEMRAEYSRLTRAVNDPKLPSQVRAEAARRAKGILTAMERLTTAGSGAAQAAIYRAESQPNPYAIPGGGTGAVDYSSLK